LEVVAIREIRILVLCMTSQSFVGLTTRTCSVYFDWEIAYTVYIYEVNIASSMNNLLAISDMRS